MERLSSRVWSLWSRGSGHRRGHTLPSLRPQADDSWFDKYDEYGLTTNPPDQFKHNVRLPTFTPKLRTAGRKFKLAIRSIMGTITNEISDTIVKWINLPALREYYDPVLDESTVVKRKRDDNDTTNNDKQNMEQQKQISTDCSTTKPSPPADSTAKPCPPADDVVMHSTTTSNTTPAYNDKYPLLSSLNIDLMNREGNLQRCIVEFMLRRHEDDARQLFDMSFAYQLG
eukprot:scaffold16752_cov85-Cyclotella_meneghiniana.AAC.5